MSNKVVIVGAGGVGQVVAHKCAQVPHVFQDIVLASRDVSKCNAIAEQIQRPIRTARLDAEVRREVVDFLKEEQPDILIHVALPYQNINLMEACLETGVHYIDTACFETREIARFDYKWQWEYHQRFCENGLTALLGGGFDPGVTNVFMAYLAKHYFDTVETLDIIDVNGGNHGLPFATNFNSEINIREITAKCRHWENGRFVETDALSLKKEFKCPEGAGTYNIYRMYHEELESLVRHFPDLRLAQFWMSFSDNYLNHLQVFKNVGMTSIHPVDYNGVKIIPLQFLKSILPAPSSLGERTTGKTCIGNLVSGTKGGEALQMFLYNICDHQDAYREVKSQAISYTTGVPAMICAKLVLEKSWLKPGVWNLEQLDPDPFMEDLGQYGLPWQIEEVGNVQREVASA